MGQVNDLLARPYHDIGISLTSAASAWGFSAWTTIFPGHPGAIALNGLQLTLDSGVADDTLAEGILEIGTGATPDLIAQVPLTWKRDTAVGHLRPGRMIVFAEPIEIAASTAIKMRWATAANSQAIATIKLQIRQTTVPAEQFFRVFDGTDDHVTFSDPGAFSGDLGPTTMAFVMRVIGAPSDQGFFGVAGEYALLKELDQNLILEVGGTFHRSSAGFQTAAMGWLIVVVRKDTGTVAPRFSKCTVGSTTWAHENAGTTQADTVGTAGNDLMLGKETDFGTFMQIWCAAAGLWDSYLSDGQVETLETNLATWAALSPDVLWRPGDTPVDDLSATGTADQTSITGTYTTQGLWASEFDLSLSVTPTGPPMQLRHVSRKAAQRSYAHA